MTTNKHSDKQISSEDGLPNMISIKPAAWKTFKRVNHHFWSVSSTDICTITPRCIPWCLVPIDPLTSNLPMHCFQSVPQYKIGVVWKQGIPSGKLSHNYGKSPFFMGKLTSSMAICNSYFDITRGYPTTIVLIGNMVINRHRGALSSRSTSLSLC